MLQPIDIHLLKNNLPFYSQLTPTEETLLLENSVSTTFDKGQIIHSGDANCVGVFFIKKGGIRAYITSNEGREITLFRLSANEICLFSASCAIPTLEFDICVFAENDCEVILINAPMFAKLVNENIQVELFTYKQLTSYFSNIMRAFEQILFTSFDRRLAHFLVSESLKNNSLKLHMTHEEIAKNLNSAREVVSRMLKYFATEGYISSFRGGIVIHDLEKLKLQS